MSEICLDCWNELNGTHYSESKYVLTDEEYICESCEEYKKVIIIERSPITQLFYIIRKKIEKLLKVKER